MEKKYRVTVEFEFEITAADEEDAMAAGYNTRLFADSDWITSIYGKQAMHPDDVYVEEVDD